LKSLFVSRSQIMCTANVVFALDSPTNGLHEAGKDWVEAGPIAKDPRRHRKSGEESNKVYDMTGRTEEPTETEKWTGSDRH